MSIALPEVCGGSRHAAVCSGRPSHPTVHLASAAPVVFVVDDDLSVRKSVELLIRCAGWQARTFGSAEEFLACSRALVPSCLVLDVSLPDLNGLELQRQLAEQPDLPIIFITGFADVPTTVRAMKAGAVEFLTKPFTDDALLDAIRHALETSQTVMIRQAELQTLRARYESLKARERQVMSLVVAGFLNKQIGYQLGISEITVKAHRGKVMRKMRADSLPALVRMASMLGLARPILQFQFAGAAAARYIDGVPFIYREGRGA